MLDNNGGIVSAKARIFEERYSGGVLDLNIFCLALIDDKEGEGSVIKGVSETSKSRHNVGSRMQDIHDEGHEEESSLGDIGINERS